MTFSRLNALVNFKGRHFTLDWNMSSSDAISWIGIQIILFQDQALVLLNHVCNKHACNISSRVWIKAGIFGDVKEKISQIILTLKYHGFDSVLRIA